MNLPEVLLTKRVQRAQGLCGAETSPLYSASKIGTRSVQPYLLADSLFVQSISACGKVLCAPALCACRIQLYSLNVLSFLNRDSDMLLSVS